MSTYQVWSRDEYGQGSILKTTDDLSEVIKTAKQGVTDMNVNNALTTDDREKNWEAYMVNISVPKKTKTKHDNIYLPGDRGAIYEINSKGEVKEVSLDDIPKAQVRIYLGNVSTTRAEEKDWFAADARRNVIETVDHQDLQGKTSFFIKVI